ncbi:MAG: hypothetical protein JWO09_3015 [Bacteroidetes bacterium]|nr:hypothetical protein [Bacteroidota bacterium]
MRATIPHFIRVLLLLLVSNQLISQISVYKPFPRIQGQWLVYKSGPHFETSIPYYFSWDKYQTAGDTIIGSYTYTKVNGASYSCTACSPAVVPYGPTTFRFAFRNDSAAKKVFIYANISGTFVDTLWYNFNLSIGDTLKKTYAINPSGLEPRIVSSIDSVSLCGIYHKRFNFTCGGGFADLGLVEGKGFEDNFLQTGYPDCPFEPYYIYHTDFSCTSTGTEGPQDLGTSFRLFPNPAGNSVTLELTSQRFTDTFDCSIVNCLGKAVMNGAATNGKTIDVSELKPGVYFILLRDKAGRVAQSKFIKQ